MAPRATDIVRAGLVTEKPWASVTLDAADRHLRRKLLSLADGGAVLVDLLTAQQLGDGDCLVLDDGRLLQVFSAPEDLLEVRAKNAAHLAQLAWHIGNRHLEAQIESSRILIRRDHVIAHMLEHQGATLRPVRETFAPEIGAYHTHGHGTHEPG